MVSDDMKKQTDTGSQGVSTIPVSGKDPPLENNSTG